MHDLVVRDLEQARNRTLGLTDSDDPTLVMRYSDGAIVPGNAGADAAEIARILERFWAPYRNTVAAKVEAMMATGEPPALV